MSRRVTLYLPPNPHWKKKWNRNGAIFMSTGWPPFRYCFSTTLQRALSMNKRMSKKEAENWSKWEKWARIFLVVFWLHLFFSACNVMPLENDGGYKPLQIKMSIFFAFWSLLIWPTYSELSRSIISDSSLPPRTLLSKRKIMTKIASWHIPNRSDMERPTSA